MKSNMLYKYGVLINGKLLYFRKKRAWTAMQSNFHQIHEVKFSEKRCTHSCERWGQRAMGWNVGKHHYMH